MSGCLDKISCDCDCEVKDRFLEWWRGGGRNMIASIVSGTLFAVGWWIIIDACVDHAEPLYGAYFICGIFSTIGLLMVNAISNARVMGDDYNEGIFGKKAARVWLFFGFLFTFAGLIGSLWVFIQVFLVPAVLEDTPITPSINPNNTAINVTTAMPSGNATTPAPVAPTVSAVGQIWQGVAFLLQNGFIFLSTLVFKFGRKDIQEDDW